MESDHLHHQAVFENRRDGIAEFIRRVIGFETAACQVVEQSLVPSDGFADVVRDREDIVQLLAGEVEDALVASDERVFFPVVELEISD